VLPRKFKSDDMRVYLVRHGVAEAQAAAGDSDRALTPKGRLRMAEEAKGLRGLKVLPEVILTSPIRRAQETAAIIGEQLGGVKQETLLELGQGFSGPTEVLAALDPYKNLKEVMLVGHQPGLGELASFMLTGSMNTCEVEFKKGGIVCLEQMERQDPDRYSLIWSMPPKVLRSL
jgi:phosphohistidine phosphatase